LVGIATAFDGGPDWPAKAIRELSDRLPVVAPVGVGQFPAIGIQVLAETGQPMACKEMIEAMATKGYWSSPGGKTPASTLYSSITKEISTKGKESRFKKTDRGRFART
jgi:hypothetical protein